MSVEIRKAKETDIDFIDEIYNHIHTEHEKGNVYTGWVRDVYPAKNTALEALKRGDLFVQVSDGKIVGTAIINKIQPDVYKEADWEYEVSNDKIMVLHTLVIDPYVKGCGFGRKFVEFYENYALENGCKSLRMDTNKLNQNARNFYKKLGYNEVGIFPCVFNGISGVNLVMLEKKLK